MNSLQATVKDFRKVTDKSVNVVKGAMYYAFIPAILYFGLKTVDWAQFSPQQAWSYKNCKTNSNDFYLLYFLRTFFISVFGKELSSKFFFWLSLIDFTKFFLFYPLKKYFR